MLISLHTTQSRLLAWSYQQATLLCLILITIGLLTACTTNPVTGKRELSLVSEQQELAIGKQYYGPYRQAQGGDYVVDPTLTDYVQSVAQRLVQVSDRKLDYEFQVINDGTPNAWALPGGKIAIHRGLLLALNSEAELAAVLAHEIIHAAARHSAQSMQRDMLLQGAVMAASVALADTKHRDLGLLGANLGAQLTGLHFGRDAEREADLYGIRYMLRAGYDPQAAIALQETFVRLKNNKQPGWIEGLFASHPPSQERVQNNRQLVQSLGNPGGRMGEDAYQRATAHLRKTREGYQKYDQAVQAVAENNLQHALTLVNQALQIEPKEALFHGLRGEIRQKQGRDTDALTNFNRALGFNPHYYRFHFARGLLHQKRQQPVAAQRDLEASVALNPTAAGVFGLGELAQARGDQAMAINYFHQVAKTQSALAKPAGKQLAQLDLAKHPARYLLTQLAVDAKQRLVIKVQNTSQVQVHQIRLWLGERVGAGVQEKTTIRLPQTVPAEQSIVVKTQMTVPDQATLRRLVIKVDQARVWGDSQSP